LPEKNDRQHGPQVKMFEFKIYVLSDRRPGKGEAGDGGHALLQTVIQHRAWSSFYHKPAACTNYCLYPAQNQGRGPAEIAIEMHRT
jgi:hypothetical protein